MVENEQRRDFLKKGLTAFLTITAASLLNGCKLEGLDWLKKEKLGKKEGMAQDEAEKWVLIRTMADLGICFELLAEGKERKLSVEEYQERLYQWFLDFDEAVASVMSGVNPFSVDLWEK